MLVPEGEMLKLVFQIIGIFILCLLGLVVIGFVIRLVSILVGLLFGVALLVGMIYLIKMMMGIGSEAAPKTFSYRVYDRNKNAIPLFVAEPSVKDLVNTQQPGKITEWALDGTILEIDNDTQVIVLNNEKEKEAVKIRVKDGQFQGREGWVCKSVLHSKEHNRLLNG